MSHYMFLSDIDGPRWALMGLVVKLAHSVSTRPRRTLHRLWLIVYGLVRSAWVVSHGFLTPQSWLTALHRPRQR
jgi:hypothetical protein